MPKNIKPESVHFDESARIDMKRGIVKNVKIIGLESRHGYSYTPKALKEAAHLYEGIRVNVDHPERSKPGIARSYRDRFGSLRGVHFVEGDGLRGNLRFNPRHPIAEQFGWDVENDPESCGFSHNAKGPLTERGGKLACESIDAVRSVDLVADAATTSSLFEGKPKMKVRRRKPDPRVVRRKLIEAFGREVARELMESLDPAAQAQVASAASGDGGGGAGGGSADANVEALLALVKRVLSDPNISADDSIKAVTKRLKALKDMIPGGVAAPAGDAGGALAEGDDNDEDVDEDDLLEDDDEDAGRRPKAKVKVKKAGAIPAEVAERLERLEAREEKVSVRELCDSLSFRPTEKQMGLLLSADDDETREDLIESWQDSTDANDRRRKINGKPAGGRAKSRDMLESEGDRGGKKYKDGKDWAADLVS